MELEKLTLEEHSDRIKASEFWDIGFSRWDNRLDPGDPGNHRRIIVTSIGVPYIAERGALRLFLTKNSAPLTIGNAVVLACLMSWFGSNLGVEYTRPMHDPAVLAQDARKLALYTSLLEAFCGKLLFNICNERVRDESPTSLGYRLLKPEYRPDERDRLVVNSVITWLLSDAAQEYREQLLHWESV